MKSSPLALLLATRFLALLLLIPTVGHGMTDVNVSDETQKLEVLVKVLNGCSENGYNWVFAAASTNLEYTLRVTDTVTDVTREYSSELGNPADTINDTLAFECQ